MELRLAIDAPFEWKVGNLLNCIISCAFVQRHGPVIDKVYDKVKSINVKMWENMQKTVRILFGDAIV